MRTRSEAEARGAVIRMQTLRHEGRTREALRVGRLLEDRVASDPYIDARFKLNLAGLLARQDDQDSATRALDLLKQLDAEFGFQVRSPRLTGDRQLAILSDLAVALNRQGKHLHAIRIHERVLERARGAGNVSRVQMQLSNLADAWRAHGYAEFCDHRDDVAVVAIERAVAYLDESLRVGFAHVAGAGVSQVEASILVRESNRLAARLELEVIRGPTDVGLTHLRSEAEQILRRSEGHLGTARAIALRFARLGSVLIEELKISHLSDSTLRGQATTARAFLQPVLDAHLLDADLPVAVGIRYADACSMAGDLDAAVHTLRLLLRRLELLRGGDYGACTRVRERLSAVDE